MLWNEAVHTDTTVTADRQDMTITNKRIRKKTCTLINVAILTDRNVMQREEEKKLKYKSLSIEIQGMWDLM